MYKVCCKVLLSEVLNQLSCKFASNVILLPCIQPEVRCKLETTRQVFQNIIKFRFHVIFTVFPYGFDSWKVPGSQKLFRCFVEVFDRQFSHFLDISLTFYTMGTTGIMRCKIIHLINFLKTYWIGVTNNVRASAVGSRIGVIWGTRTAVAAAAIAACCKAISFDLLLPSVQYHTF